MPCWPADAAAVNNDAKSAQPAAHEAPSAAEAQESDSAVNEVRGAPNAASDGALDLDPHSDDVGEAVGTSGATRCGGIVSSSPEQASGLHQPRQADGSSEERIPCCTQPEQQA